MYTSYRAMQWGIKHFKTEREKRKATERCETHKDEFQNEAFHLNVVLFQFKQ